MAVTINASTTAGLVQTADTSGVLALQTAGTTVLTVDASANTIISSTGTSYASVAALTAMTPRLQVHGTSLGTSAVAQYAWNSTNAYHTFNTSGAGSIGTHTAVTTSDTLGNIQFNGSDGTSFVGSSSIKGYPDSTVSTGIVPGNLRFYTASSAGTLTERMRIDSSGNVGIGTTSPQKKLDVTVNDVSTAQLYLRNNNASYASGLVIYNAGGEASMFRHNGGSDTSYGGANSVNIGSLTNNNVAFITNNSEKMRIDGSGNVGIGTTTPSSFALLSVENSSNNRAGWFYVSAASSLSTPSVTFVKKDNNTTTSQVLANFYVNGSLTAQGQINANGASAAAFGSFSDRRLKENIVDLPPQLANIMALRTVEFDYIESEGGGHQIGFIAQEVQQVYPDLVGEREDGMLTLTDLNKNDARLIKAIQEQQALITQLQADVAALKGATA